MSESSVPQRVRVGISRCLLGEEVRYDGGHKHDRFITDTLGKYFEWISVCPEVEAGMGVPRESVRLIADGESVRVLGVRTQQDFTGILSNYSVHKVKMLLKEDVHGFILKKDSPSCGMERVRVYRKDAASKTGSGVFASELMAKMPDLPVEEEGRLHDLALRENFIERVFAHYRWSEFVKSRPRARDLVEFHTSQKLTVLSHHRPSYQEMGRLVSNAGKTPLPELLSKYGAIYMSALKHRATPKKHSNVLYHLLGYLKDSLDRADKAEMIECIENYRTEKLPLIVPLTLLTHHFRKHPSAWVLSQTYFHPYPAELMLRNHV